MPSRLLSATGPYHRSPPVGLLRGVARGQRSGSRLDIRLHRQTLSGLSLAPAFSGFVSAAKRGGTLCCGCGRITRATRDQGYDVCAEPYLCGRPGEKGRSLAIARSTRVVLPRALRYTLLQVVDRSCVAAAQAA